MLPLKIALCQINTTVGAFRSNLEKVRDWYEDAISKGAELVVFPELSVTGYPPSDLLHESDFVFANEYALKKFAKEVTIPAIVGYVRSSAGKLYNSAVLINKGEIVDIYDKLLLPTYDVFDERRYFTAGDSPRIWYLEIDGRKYRIGIEICEDLWDADYPIKVTSELSRLGAELIINISASPFHEGRLTDRYQLIKSKVSATGLPFLYCNLIGGQDELVFDGQSLAIDGAGKLLAQGAAFSEQLMLIDLEQPGQSELVTTSREEELFNALRLGIKDYMRKSGFKDVVIGLSGGIDSTLVACIAAAAAGPEHVHGIAMPSKYSSDHSVNDARQLAKNLGMDFRIVPIQKIVDSLESELAADFAGLERGLTEENNQARVRGDIIMAYSNKLNWLVISCGNKTELALGYCTLYGDMVGGLAAISDLSKTDVYALARWINSHAGEEIIPNNCIAKAPSAELSPDQVDPFDYEIVSPLVDAIIEDRQSTKTLIENGYDHDLVREIYQMVQRNEYKRRQAAPGIRVSPKAFGTGRRVPIVNHYKGTSLEEINE
ncbi:MAG: NAD+ synthase [Candidatus Marinimicrobia bacterium]|nr:NAD+ synthase [Candidatus Neomarinimicrobiota bacterium]